MFKYFINFIITHENVYTVCSDLYSIIISCIYKRQKIDDKEDDKIIFS